jgi:6-phosphogluconate dehydrogenase
MSLIQGGCIIRAEFLDDIKKAYARDPELTNLLVDPEFAARLAASQVSGCRGVLVDTWLQGCPSRYVAAGVSY